MAALRRPIDLVPGIERTADKASDLRSCARIRPLTQVRRCGLLAEIPQELL